MFQPTDKEIELKNKIITLLNNNRGNIKHIDYNDIIITTLYNLTLDYIQHTLLQIEEKNVNKVISHCRNVINKSFEEMIEDTFNNQ